MAFRGLFQLVFQATHTKSGGAVHDPQARGHSLNVTKKTLDGNAADKASKALQLKSTLGAASNEDQDLSILVDGFNVASAGTGVAFLRIANTGTGDLAVKPASSNGWKGAAALFGDVSDVINIPAGVTIYVEAVGTITYALSGTSKALNFAATAGTDYEVTLWNRQA